MAVRLNFNTSDVRLAAEIRAKGGAITEALAAKMTYLMLELQKKIVVEELSGQVLHHRTGRLAGSIVAQPVEVSGNTMRGTVTGAGGPAWYGKVHEFGGTRAYPILPVNKKALAFFPSESVGGGIGRMGSVGVGKAVLRGLYRGTGELRTSAAKLKTFDEMGGVVVKGVMHPPLPQRAFMAPAIEAMRERIVQQLQQAVGQALKKRGGRVQ